MHTGDLFHSLSMEVMDAVWLILDHPWYNLIPKYYQWDCSICIVCDFLLTLGANDFSGEQMWFGGWESGREGSRSKPGTQF